MSGKAPRRSLSGDRYVDPLHPVWLDGSVPKDFWQDASNRRTYLLWLDKRLRFQTPEDWYRIRTADIQKNHGAGVRYMHWLGQRLGFKRPEDWY
ncbi:MAG: hypothetical protein ACREHD_33880, partial [Pirellulales bacterium]